MILHRTRFQDFADKFLIIFVLEFFILEKSVYYIYIYIYIVYIHIIILREKIVYFFTK